jgi:hypothetical protein
MASIIEHPNSIWPNGLKIDSENYVTFYPLGTNKVDISTVTWPDGDKLVSPFVYKNDKLVGFVDTKAMTVSGSATTTMNYSHIEADFSSILEGKLTVDAPNAIVKEFRWSVVDSGDDNVIVTLKYKGCSTVDEVKVVDPAYKTTDIVDGVWGEGLGDLDNGNGMFAGCSNLKTFKSDLSSLTVGSGMFYSCTNLTSFSAKLPKLSYAQSMFVGCKLDTASIQLIADTINTVSSTAIQIGIGNSTPNEEEKAAFNKMVSKGWIVYVITNGGGSLQWTPTSLTPIDGEEQQTPTPFWAKPVPSDEEYAQYVDSEGNFYNILGGNYIYGDDISTYGMFTCEDDAAAQMRLTKIEK